MTHPRKHPSEQTRSAEPGPDIAPRKSGKAQKPAPRPSDIERGADSSRQVAPPPDVDPLSDETDDIEYRSEGLPRTAKYSVDKQSARDDV